MKMRKATSGSFKKGHKGYKPWLGKKLPSHVVEGKRKSMLGKRGAETSAWKGGKKLSYSQYHKRVVIAFGKPDYCEFCGKSEPSNGKKKYDWANLNGKYWNLNDYMRMCKPCHRYYDNSKRT